METELFEDVKLDKGKKLKTLFDLENFLIKIKLNIIMLNLFATLLHNTKYFQSK